MDVGMQRIGTVDRAGTRHGDGVIVARAALGRGQIVPAAPLEEMRALDKAKRAPGEDVFRRPDQSAGGRVPFLEEDAEKRRVFEVRARRAAMVPDHVDEPLASVVVVKQRRIEAARVDIDRIGPFGLDRGRRDDVVMGVLEVAVEAFDVGVDEPEFAVGVGEAGRPDAAGIRFAAHVELRGALKRAPHEPPIDEIARVVDLHARKPFEGRGGDVIIVAHAADRRVRIEARQDRVVNHGHGRLYQRAAHSMPRSRMVFISGTSNSAVTWPSEE